MVITCELRQTPGWFNRDTISGANYCSDSPTEIRSQSLIGKQMTGLLVLPSNEQRTSYIRCSGRSKEFPPFWRLDKPDVPKPIALAHLLIRPWIVDIGSTMLSHAATNRKVIFAGKIFMQKQMDKSCYQRKMLKHGKKWKSPWQEFSKVCIIFTEFVSLISEMTVPLS